MNALLVGYARVSTEQQDLTAQRQALDALGVGDDRIYVDHGLTGTNRSRPGLALALAACRSGDILLREIVMLGHTLKKRAEDVLAYFDRPGTSNGPTEAINGRIEHLRGPVLGFRNLTNYIARSLLETGGFRPQLHPRL